MAKIHIGGVSSQALIDIIQYFYTGILKIEQENVMELLEVADVLLLEQVSYTHPAEMLSTAIQFSQT